MKSGINLHISGSWHTIGDFIELCSARNSNLHYGIESVMGMTITKEIIPTKADLSGNDLSKMLIVYPEEFVYNPRTHGKRIGLGYNSTSSPFLISWNNTAFRIKDKEKLLPEYLYMWICRDEWDRNACYNSWGSSTEVFSWDAFCRMPIFLPKKDDQAKVINAWASLRQLKKDNELLSEPLFQLCQSKIQELKHTCQLSVLGDYIEECNNRNTEDVFTAENLMGVCSEGTFIKSIANTQGLVFTNYKIVRTGEFAYSNRINVGSIALRYDEDCIVSPSYAVFRVKPDKKSVLLNDYLALWFRRSEFLRSTLFFAFGTIKDDFSHREMCRVKLPIPPIEEQQAIVDMYRCSQEAKRIAAEADNLSREICPALMQKVINS